MIAEVDSAFDQDAFLTDALDGYQALELTPRAWQIAHALGRHLPQDYERAIEILIALGQARSGRTHRHRRIHLHATRVLRSEVRRRSLRGVDARIRADAAVHGGVQHSSLPRALSAADARPAPGVGA